VSAALPAGQEIVGIPQQETPFRFHQSHLRDRLGIAIERFTDERKVAAAGSCVTLPGTLSVAVALPYSNASPCTVSNTSGHTVPSHSTFCMSPSRCYPSARASLIWGAFIPVADRLQVPRSQSQWILGWAGSWAYLSSGNPLYERNPKATIPRPTTSTLSGLLSQCSCEWVIHCIGRRGAVEAESAGMSQSSHLHSLWTCRLCLRGCTPRSYNWAGARSEHGDQPLAIKDRYAVVHMHSIVRRYLIGLPPPKVTVYSQ
jgi:hypothetical protein